VGKLTSRKRSVSLFFLSNFFHHQLYLDLIFSSALPNGPAGDLCESRDQRFSADCSLQRNHHLPTARECSRQSMFEPQITDQKSPSSTLVLCILRIRDHQLSNWDRCTSWRNENLRFIVYLSEGCMNFWRILKCSVVVFRHFEAINSWYSLRRPNFKDRKFLGFLLFWLRKKTSEASWKTYFWLVFVSLKENSWSNHYGQSRGPKM
jgi:hypothetical protein